MRRVLLSLVISLGLFMPVSAYEGGAYNELGVDFPIDGGAMLTYARMWQVSRYLHLGAEIGGGQIQREFEVKSGATEFDVETDTLVLPFIGPRVMLRFPVVALSLGFSFFRAEADIEAKASGFETMRGETKGWGTAFHSPFLVLDFYDKQRKMVFGFGLGGFFGTSFKDLEATSSTGRLVTDENPLDTLTIHFRTLWGDADPNPPVEEL